MAAPVTQLESGTLENQVLAIIRELLLEQGKTQEAGKLAPASSFQRDLGLASLDLVELVVRCESKLDIELPDEIAEQADSPAGWVRAIQQGSHDSQAKSVYRIVPPSADAPAAPGTARNLAEVLRWHAEAGPGRVHMHLFEEGSGQGITCAQLLNAAETVARGLISKGLRRNDTVALMLPNSADFLHAFFGVVLAGGIPVPIYPPADSSRIAEYTGRQIGLLANAQARFLISFERARAVWPILRVRLPGLLEVTTVAALAELGRRASGRLPQPSGTALIQYTSGSTAEPKGVVLTQAGVLANIRAVGERLSVKPNDAVVSWLPLCSDMGLVGCWLFSLYHGTPLTLLAPQEFQRRPESWLWAIHDSRGTLSAAPNSAYEHCVRRIPMWTLDGIDLSCWRVAVNAGEPVLPSTVRGFVRRFRSTGFRAEAVLPAYGLAESSVALALPVPGHAPAPDEDGFYPVGTPLKGHHVRVVADDGSEVAPGTVGHLQLLRLSSGGGYVGVENPEAQRAAQQAPFCANYMQAQRAAQQAPSCASEPEQWLDSGDLARITDGQITITGRAKEIILKQGRGLAPQAIESAVNDVPGVRAGFVAAIGVPDAMTGTETLVVVAESAATDRMDMQRVRAGVESAVADAIGTDPDEVLLIPPGTLPKTANGKLRRQQSKQLYLAGRLGAQPPPVWLQISGLWTRNSAGLVWNGLAGAVTASRRALVHTLARVVALAGGCLARVAGARWVPVAARWVLRVLGRMPKHEGLALRGPVVVMANRCGPLDPVSLAALVSGDVLFAGAEALHGLPPTTAFLLRPAVAASREEIARALRAKAVVILLPDSPVGVTAARSRFRLDALRAAIDEKVPVVPLAMQELQDQTLTQSGEAIASQGLPVTDLREKVRESLRRVYA
ncbi:MAG: AMP-binding protein [Acidobacteriia bacterium]|nr:AMP-binding protein [Terriglobia bacterium]